MAAEESGAVKVVVHYTLRALTWLIVATALGIWLLIGFIFWVPLLIRAGIAFSIEVMNATMTGRNADAAGLMLSRAVNFYRAGFVTAIEAIQDKPSSQYRTGPQIVRDRPWVEDEEDDELEVGLDPRGFLNEVGWTVLIWYLIASAVGWTAWTPARALGEFFAIDWGYHLNIVWYSISSWFTGLWP